MKRSLVLILLCLGLSIPSLAQAPVQHGILLGWTASPSGAGVTYNVYSSPTASGTVTKLTPTPIAALTFLDTTATDGKAHFYVVTAVQGGIESANSGQATAVALNVPNPPTGLTAKPQ